MSSTRSPVPGGSTSINATGMPATSSGQDREGAAVRHEQGNRDFWTSQSLRRLDMSTNENERRRRLTVDGLGKVDQAMQRLSEEETASSPLLVATLARWVLAIFLFVGFLACLVFSRLSVVRMGSVLFTMLNDSMHDTSSHSHGTNASSRHSAKSVSVSSSQTVQGAESTFLMFLITILLPYTLTLLRCVWFGGFRGDRPWPSAKSFCLGLLSSVAEAFGVSLFAMQVLAKNPNYVTVWVINGVFLVPVIQQIAQNVHEHRKYNLPLRKWVLMALVSAFIFQTVGIIITCIFELGHTGLHNSLSDVWQIPVSLFSISVAWTPYLQQQQLLPNKDTLKKLVESKPVLKYKDISGPTLDLGVVNSSHITNGIDSYATLSSMWADSDITDKEAEWLVFTYPQLSARWKNSILQNLIKIVLIFGLCLLFGNFWNRVDVARLDIAVWNINSQHIVFLPFLCSIFTSFGGYILGWLACTTCLQKPCFAIPLALSTPLSLLLVLLWDNEKIKPLWPQHDLYLKEIMRPYTLSMVVVAALLFITAQIISTLIFIFKTQTIVMEMESHLFWLPGYNSIFLEQHMMLSRKNIQTDVAQENHKQKAQQTRVFICTTMYREATHEMEQLLKSLRLINIAKQESNRQFESHIFFDNGVRGMRLTPFALQLVAIAKKTLGIDMGNCAKTQTPYGFRLTWEMPRVYSQNATPNTTGMMFAIHLKDNKKVKNKKRWSQVMYMSYVLDYLIKEEKGSDGDSFILTTDADIEFKTESVEALLDLMTRDQHVGAVCARTFPLGSGPIYWFQIFDYAIGHWLQKATNHVLGSVLCSPGCFSVFRCAALRDVLPTYASKVDRASEFLTKDMGEDRWLCTLLIKSGWRLEYCAAADCSTYCPEEFDEFFKQRRRWIPSTLANLLLLLQEWKDIRLFNKQISLMFLLYQAALLFSTLITPSVCILIIIGGLEYAWGVNQIFSLVCLILLCAVFTIVCIYCSQETQLKWAKIITTLLSLVMTAVYIGTIVQMVGDQTKKSLSPDDPHNDTTPPPHPINRSFVNSPLEVTFPPDSFPAFPLQIADVRPTTEEPDAIPLPLSISALYFLGLMGLFILTGLMHLPEFYCLVHGIWYLLCLPTANIILMIYSVCNITDRSWGTREEKSSDNPQASGSWTDQLNEFCKIICVCCREKFERSAPTIQSEPTVTSSCQDDIQEEDEEEEEEEKVKVKVTDRLKPPRESFATSSTERISAIRSRAPERSHSIISSGGVFLSGPAEIKPIPVSRWLPRDLKAAYAHAFEKNGYDDTSFISGIGHKELEQIGISSPVHRNKLLTEIRDLPDYDIDPCVPTSVKDWLDSIGLGVYKSHFRTCQITTTRDLENLKSMSHQELITDLGIHKPGHLKRLLLAIKALRYPTKTELRINEVKYELEALETFDLKTISPEENEFWDMLRESCLLPDSVAFAHDHDLKVKLTELRDTALMGFVISNAMWLILILTLTAHSQLNVLHTNALGLSFLVVFGIVLVIQFLAMLFHRCNTWIHLIARAPLRCGAPSNTNWSFKDKHLLSVEENDDQEAQTFMNQYNRLATLRYQQSVNRRRKGVVRNNTARIKREADDRQTLICNDVHTYNNP